jgi:hypothetical protein
MELVMAACMPVVIIGMVACMFLYTRSGSKLVKKLESNAPEVWQDLGCPQEIYIRGMDGGGIHTIKPLFPYLSWLVAGRPGHLRYDIKKLYDKTRGLFLIAAISFIVTVVGILGLVAISS